ncbi:MAG: DUF2611 domain-containing protein [Enterocloster asparagiformis]|nr:DUF2611 domain-containing protein [Enterocloster asparagiformis]
MKKHYLAIAVLALALGMTACSSKKAEETTAAQTTAAETTAAAASESDQEEEYFYGYVKELTDKIVTVEDDEGKQAKFTYADAEFSDDKKLGVGDEVEVTYYGELSDGENQAVFIDIVTSAAEEAEEAAAAEEDPVANGTIEKVDGKTMTVKTEDGTYTFDTTIAQQVTKGGIKAGVEAEITYYGDPEDEEEPAMATRIVTEDASDSADADIYTLTGKVLQVNSNTVVLETSDKDKSIFTFVGEDGMFDGLAEGDTATVSYEGTLTGRTIVATGLQ